MYASIVCNNANLDPNWEIYERHVCSRNANRSAALLFDGTRCGRLDYFTRNNRVLWELHIAFLYAKQAGSCKPPIDIFSQQILIEKVLPTPVYKAAR